MGIGEVRFGMTTLEVMAVLGVPDVILVDEEDPDKNTVYQYNALQLRLTFYSNENNRLLYIRTTHPETTLEGIKIIHQPLLSVFEGLNTTKEEWGEALYFSFNWYFNEDRWLTLHEEYGRITHVEMGATFIDELESNSSD